MEPAAAPKSVRAMPRVNALHAAPGNTSTRPNATELTLHSSLLPWRAISQPVIGMEIRDPSPTPARQVPRIAGES